MRINTLGARFTSSLQRLPRVWQHHQAAFLMRNEFINLDWIVTGLVSRVQKPFFFLVFFELHHELRNLGTESWICILDYNWFQMILKPFHTHLEFSCWNMISRFEINSVFWVITSISCNLTEFYMYLDIYFFESAFPFANLKIPKCHMIPLC